MNKQQLLAWFAQPETQLPEETLNTLVADLAQQQEWSLLIQLLTDSNYNQHWFAQRRKAHGTSACNADLSLLWQHAIHSQNHSLALHCSLIKASITHLEWPPNQYGHYISYSFAWASEQLQHQIADDIRDYTSKPQQTQLLVQLAIASPALRTTLSHELIDEHFADDPNLLVPLLPYLPSEQQQQLANEVLEHTLQPGNYTDKNSSMFEAYTPYLSEADYQYALEQALLANKQKQRAILLQALAARAELPTSFFEILSQIEDRYYHYSILRSLLRNHQGPAYQSLHPFILQQLDQNPDLAHLGLENLLQLIPSSYHHDLLNYAPNQQAIRLAKYGEFRQAHSRIQITNFLFEHLKPEQQQQHRQHIQHILDQHLIDWLHNTENVPELKYIDQLNGLQISQQQSSNVLDQLSHFEDLTSVLWKIAWLKQPQLLQHMLERADQHQIPYSAISAYMLIREQLPQLDTPERYQAMLNEFEQYTQQNYDSGELEPSGIAFEVIDIAPYLTPPDRSTQLQRALMALSEDYGESNYDQCFDELHALIIQSPQGIDLQSYLFALSTQVGRQAVLQQIQQFQQLIPLEASDWQQLAQHIQQLELIWP
jgi:hypothetical protein